MQKYSVIIPALNEADCLPDALERLQTARGRGHEVILADGGSVDATRELAQGRVDQILECDPGRARQMNRGAEIATGGVYVFLHADTLLSPDFDRTLDNLFVSENDWGRFDIKLSGEQPVFRCIETMMNIRSRLTGIATGDQAIFAGRQIFQEVKGYAELPLMEDLKLTARLKKKSPPVCVAEKVISSSRRWEKNGALKTILLMWKLRLRYALGHDPKALAREYHAAD